MQEVYEDRTESEVKPLTPSEEVQEIVAALQKQFVRYVKVYQRGRPAFVARRATRARPLTRVEKKQKRKEAKTSRKRNNRRRGKK